MKDLVAIKSQFNITSKGHSEHCYVIYLGLPIIVNIVKNLLSEKGTASSGCYLLTVVQWLGGGHSLSPDSNNPCEESISVKESKGERELTAETYQIHIIRN